MQQLITFLAFILLIVTTGVRGQSSGDEEQKQFSLHTVSKICWYNNKKVFPSGGGGFGVSFSGIGGAWPGTASVAAPDSVPLANLFNRFDSVLKLPGYRRGWFYPEGELDAAKERQTAMWRNNDSGVVAAKYSKRESGLQYAKLEQMRTWVTTREPVAYQRNCLLRVSKTITVDSGPSETHDSFVPVIIPANDTHSSPVDFKPGILTKLVNNLVVETPFTASYREEVRVSLFPVEVVPDYNRDGKIDQADRGKVSAEKPWHFWVNDNDDSGTVDGSDIPGSGNNGNDSQVNGIRDLVDWFPLFIDIKEILKVLPSADYDYVLENANNALNMVETTLTPANVSDFLKAELGEPSQRNNPNGVALAHIAGYFKHVDAQDAKLSADFLSRAENGTGGVLIIEASKATTQPLKLVIRKKSGGESVAEVSFPLSVQSVEKMYRHLNILSANGQSGGVATNLNEPENQPDAESSSKNFVFVHGYNVNPTQARGGNAAMFKRLWHSGSRAKFTGVTWYGYESQDALIPGVTPNYQANVPFASA